MEYEGSWVFDLLVGSLAQIFRSPITTLTLRMTQRRKSRRPRRGRQRDAETGIEQCGDVDLWGGADTLAIDLIHIFKLTSLKVIEITGTVLFRARVSIQS
jgi:hypothetical protein